MKRLVCLIVVLFLLAACGKQKKPLGARQGKAGGLSVVLTWAVSNSPDATTQKVFRGQTAGGEDYAAPITILGENTTATYTDTANLVYGQTYYYTVEACSGAAGENCSSPSNEAQVTMVAPPTPPPNAPTNLTGVQQ